MKTILMVRSLFLFMGVVLLSCSSNRIKSINIIYGPEEATVIVPITCSSIEYDLIGIKKKRIYDQTFLQKVRDELEKLKIDSENNQSTKSVDIRIKCFLNYENKTDTLCLGEFFGTVLNGELMIDNPALLKLIKSNIYVNQ